MKVSRSRRSSSPAARGRDRHLQRRAPRAPPVLAARGRGAPDAGGRHLPPHPRKVLGGGSRSARDARSPARAVRGARGRGRLSCSRSTDALAALAAGGVRGGRAPRGRAEVVVAGDGFRFGPARRATSRSSHGSASTRVMCSSSRTSPRRAIRAPRSQAGDVAGRRGCSGGRLEVEGWSSSGDRRGVGSASRPRTSSVPAGLLVPADGIYAGEAADTRAASRSAPIRTTAARSGASSVPARLRGRPLRTAARRRALGAPARRGGVRVRGGAGRADRARRRAPRAARRAT